MCGYSVWQPSWSACRRMSQVSADLAMNILNTTSIKHSFLWSQYYKKWPSILHDFGPQICHTGLISIHWESLNPHFAMENPDKVFFPPHIQQSHTNFYSYFCIIYIYTFVSLWSYQRNCPRVDQWHHGTISHNMLITLLQVHYLFTENRGSRNLGQSHLYKNRNTFKPSNEKFCVFKRCKFACILSEIESKFGAFGKQIYVLLRVITRFSYTFTFCTSRKDYIMHWASTKLKTLTKKKASSLIVSYALACNGLCLFIVACTSIEKGKKCQLINLNSYS